MASVPEKLHRIVARYMKEKPHGGIWLGDSSLLKLGHPAWSTENRDTAPTGWSAGSTFDDPSGVYDAPNRAILLGRGSDFGRGGSVDTPVHEFAHALDPAIGWRGSSPAFIEVHARVLPLIQETSPGSAAYFNQPDDFRGQRELWAEGFAWFNATHQPDGSALPGSSKQPAFLNSVAAGLHLRDYYQTQYSRLGITDE
ncbi:hypothetical protein [Nocardia sp. CY41]|uniref:hypothetical protein n=1 Tax=Nocardia sp. CY41 TaxID=2608686 RepID=UPI00135B08BC|nr:hypothetical protein [Nocardia sp. CY41]